MGIEASGLLGLVSVLAPVLALYAQCDFYCPHAVGAAFTLPVALCYRGTHAMGPLWGHLEPFHAPGCYLSLPV